MVFNATFSNISAISWRPVLVVEEAGVPGENNRPWASNWYTCGCESSAPFFSSPVPKDHVSFCHHFASVVVVARVCKLFIFSSSSLQPLNRFGPNLFIGRSSTRFAILVQIGNPTWLPEPLMCSDWLKLWKSSCHKLLSRWNCNIIEMMSGPLPSLLFLCQSHIQDGRHDLT